MFTQLGIPNIQVSKLQNCFYCGGKLPATEKEHIFNSCWGGSHKTSKLICNSCNEAFSKIDSAFSIYTNLTMNAHGFKGERHKSVPRIPIGDNYLLDAYGKPKLKSPQINEWKVQPDGSSKSNFCFNSKREARRWFEDPANQEVYFDRRLTGNELDGILQSIKTSEFQSEVLGPQEISLKLNLPYQYRLVAHTLLKCLGFYSPDCVCNNVTNEVRKFARYDQGNWQKFAIIVDQSLYNITAQAVEAFGFRFNMAEIYWCSYLNKIIGVITLLGHIKRSVILADTYHGPDVVLAVVEDTHGSKKLHPFFWELDPQIPSIPLVKIQSYSPPIQLFQDEIQRLTTASPFEGCMASLISNLEKISKDMPQINVPTLKKYEESFLEFVSHLEKFFGVTIKPLEVSSKLEENGFLDLSQHHLNKNHQKDPQVWSILEKALNETLKYLISQVQVQGKNTETK